MNAERLPQVSHLQKLERSCAPDVEHFSLTLLLFRCIDRECRCLLREEYAVVEWCQVWDNDSRSRWPRVLSA